MSKRIYNKSTETGTVPTQRVFGGGSFSVALQGLHEVDSVTCSKHALSGFTFHNKDVNLEDGSNIPMGNEAVDFGRLSPELKVRLADSELGKLLKDIFEEIPTDDYINGVHLTALTANAGA